MSLYRHLLGPRFTQMHASLQHLHDSRGPVQYGGWCEVDGAPSLLGRWCSRLLALPASSSGSAFAFELVPDSSGESWHRHFPGRKFQSHLGRAGELLVERLGGVALYFSLAVEDGQLRQALQDVRLLGCSCPRWLLPCVQAHEWGTPGRMHFSVQVALPLLGHLTHYRGFLQLEPEAAP